METASETVTQTGAVEPHEKIDVQPTQEQLESLNVVEDPVRTAEDYIDYGQGETEESDQIDLDLEEDSEDSEYIPLEDQIEAAGFSDVDALIQDIEDFGVFDEKSFEELADLFGEEVATQIEEEFIASYEGGEDEVSEELEELRQFKEEVELESLVEQAAAPLGGRDQMVQDANRLLDAGLASEEELEELGSMLMSGGIQAELAIERFTGKLNSLGQPSTFHLGGEHLQSNTNMKISQREYGKLATEASNKGDTQALEILNKRMIYSLKAFPHLWE